MPIAAQSAEARTALLAPIVMDNSISEKSPFRDSQRAVLNILEDFSED